MTPYARRVTLRIDEEAAEPEAPSFRRVLFVSADADLRRTIARTLEQDGYEVHAVPHSGHALLSCLRMKVDVLLTELNGPDLSGPCLAEQLRRRCPGLPVLFLGKPGTPEGLASVLVPPFTREDLVGRIERALRAGEGFPVAES